MPDDKMTETKNKTEKIEREYVIPLRHRWQIVPRYQRANKAVRAIKEFLARHMKIRDRDMDKIRVDRYLNEAVWFRGIKNPPSKIKVKAIKDGDIVRAELAEPTGNLKFKKLREEKKENLAKEVVKKKKKEAVEEKAEDKNNDGVEDKKEVSSEQVQASSDEERQAKEKKESTIEAEQKLEKAEAKEMKHTTKVKSPKQEKNQRTGYNQSGRGH